MPCDSVERSKIAFLANTTDVTLLAKGLAKKGFNVRQTATGLQISRYGQYGSYDKRTGRLDIPQSWDIDEFKRGYAEEVVTQQAAENGWEVEWRTNEAGNREAEVTKRV